jgi:hypothetical protein
VDSLDGVVHSIGFAPQTALGGGFLALHGRTWPRRCRCPPTPTRRSPRPHCR